MKPLIARVLLDTPLPQLDHLFDYSVPTDLQTEIRVGQRVKVPFRSRRRDVVGYVIELTDESDYKGKLAQLSEIVSSIPLLKPEVWELVRAVADRAGGSAGDILRIAIAPRQIRAEKSYLAQQENSESTNTQFNPVLMHESSLNIAEKLLHGGRVHLDIMEPLVRLETGEWVSAWAKIFSEIAIATSNSGKSAIIVVPDFRDIDQLFDTLNALGAENCIRFDAKLPAGERYKQFLTALQDKPQIVIGNRSTVYAPAFNLGAILVWGESDESLIEPLSPYVHARDAALVRASLSGCGLVFGAHTRSTQMQRLIDMAYLEPISLGQKYPKIIHTAALPRPEEQTGRIPQFATKVIREGLALGPVLVQVASPGFSPAMVCQTCKELARCVNCTGPFQSTISGGVSCRLCLKPPTNWKCSHCESVKMIAIGAGSERTAQQFESIFPGVPIVISDGSHKIVRVDARPKLVVATRGAEPIAAGGYRAVVILDVEKMIGSWHLHAGEDALRWWRGALSLTAHDATCVLAGGGGPIVDALVKGTDEEWARAELEDRVQLRFPPAVRIATLQGEKNAVENAANKVAGLPGVDVLGPTAIKDDQVRSIVRFDYTQGQTVATELRAELLRGIAERSAKRYVQSKARPEKRTDQVALRLRFDDETVFDDRGEG